MKAFVASFALFGLLGCGSSDSPTATYTPPVVPSLETVPYALLGSGKVAFERIGGNGGYNAVYTLLHSCMSPPCPCFRMKTEKIL